MSISRKNWSALSSLARQWTMEDEEEVEREKRRRVRSSSTADPDDDSFSAPRKSSSSDAASETESSSETAQGLSSVEQMQLDFVEMLRVRDERRRMRHVETLRRQKEEEEDGVKETSGGEGVGGVALLAELDEEKGSVFKPQPPVKPSSGSPSISSNSRTDTASKQDQNDDEDKTLSFHSGHRTSSSSRSMKTMERQASQQEKEESSRNYSEPDQKPVSNPARKFVSSVSISLDKSSSPMSPCSPTGPFSPRERWPSPCQSQSSHGAQSPVQNGHAQETGLNSPSADGVFEQTSKPAFTRQSSRTISFRMMRKKEEETGPLQRSASVRMASKKFEPDTDQNEDEDKTSFQRNSRQRISSRSIKEKMERLAQAAQKSEAARSPDVTQRTLFLMEEVSRKRSLFEKDEKEQSLTSPGASRQEFRSFTSGMSDRVNHWLNKTNQPGSPISLDLRHVDISSKRSLFENRGEESVSKSIPGKIYK